MKKMLNRFFLPLLGLLFAGTLSVAAASDVKAPDALVKDVTNEVLEIVRADKAIQAGDTKRVIELVDAKVLPHFDFRRMTMRYGLFLARTMTSWFTWLGKCQGYCRHA